MRSENNYLSVSSHLLAARPNRRHRVQVRWQSGEFNLAGAAKNDLVDNLDCLGLMTCREVCREAWKDPEANRHLASHGGGVVCYQGYTCPCLGYMPNAGYYAGECPLIDMIVLIHESNHAAKVHCRGCSLHVAGPDDLSVPFVQEECVQRADSVLRLYSIRGNLDGKCERVATQMIEYLERFLNEECH